ncbi:hypothetical protein [Chelativorans sp. AA-79]|uniref:hypothetical protein n=1 Tax=Chelativorans sp. AA-79 TaxID=3028735 RepID=UPI0023F821FD|nr:hypothetical protein [Chelativorans sp. AA-79]WEX10841.1 hypothetical protein PVE73_07875 [Chelativorans sp. AA-79]
MATYNLEAEPRGERLERVVAQIAIDDTAQRSHTTSAAASTGFSTHGFSLYDREIEANGIAD